MDRITEWYHMMCCCYAGVNVWLRQQRVAFGGSYDILSKITTHTAEKEEHIEDAAKGKYAPAITVATICRLGSNSFCRCSCGDAAILWRCCDHVL